MHVPHVPMLKERAKNKKIDGWRRGWDSFPTIAPINDLGLIENARTRQIHSKPEYQVQIKYSDSIAPSTPSGRSC